MAIGLVFNFLCLALLIRERPGKVMAAAGLAWLLVVSSASFTSATSMLRHEIPQRTELYRAGEHNVKEYVRTGDMSHLNGQQIPFPDAAWLARMLDRPSLRKLLPASVNDGSWSSGFSEAIRWFASQGWAVMGAGAAMAAAAAFGLFRTPPPVLSENETRACTSRCWKRFPRPTGANQPPSAGSWPRAGPRWW